jgi:hypothetical protein
LGFVQGLQHVDRRRGDVFGACDGAGWVDGEGGAEGLGLAVGEAVWSGRGGLVREAIFEIGGRIERGPVQKVCSGGGCGVVLWAAWVAMCRVSVRCCLVWRRLALRQPRGRLANGAAFIV